MTIKIWNSFSCNNSSSYRLVARFATPADARATADELAAFLAAHAQEMDAALDAGEGFPEDPPPAARALASKHGFTWEHVLAWGDDLQTGDEPSVTAEAEVLLVYHPYCNGFGSLPAYLAKRGATVEPEIHTAPHVSVLFARPEPANATLERELDAVFAQRDLDDDVETFRPPWPKSHQTYGEVAFFRDRHTVGLYFPIEPEDLPACKAWLASRGVTKLSLRICEYADKPKFAAIAKARCASCDEPLALMTPRLHDLDREQLACHACGGLYDLSTFVNVKKA